MEIFHNLKAKNKTILNMTKKTIFPVLVKVLHVTHTPLGYRPKEYRVEDRKVLHIGKYYIAEHSKTPGLNKGDKFIIVEHFGQRCY